MEDCTDRHAERGLAIVTVVTVWGTGSIGGTAIRAGWISAPTGLLKMSDAIYLRWKPFENLSDVQGILSRIGRLTESI